jgi:cullin-associated NEDD8-dissociated protein 1
VTGYKAIVYMFLAGALDSYSALVPLNCPLHDQYLSVRGDVAITSGLLGIDATSSNQPCASFGLHPSLQNLHQLYNDGDSSFVANIGPLVMPLNKYEFEANSKPQPQALFAHNTQTQITQSVFAQDSSAGGVLGRIGDVLNQQEGAEIFDAYSISGTPKILQGAPGVSKPADVLSSWGVASFNWVSKPFQDNIEALSKNIVTSIYGETFSASMTNTIYRTQLLENVIDDVTLSNSACFVAIDTDIGNQFEQVARIIKSRDGLEAKRDVFYLQHGGYDTHSDNGPALAGLLEQVDDALGCFVTEMKSQGIWNNVTVVSASEFGRTLTSNGLGTDHAWGGNHFIAGGSVRGGNIHGEFPDDLTDNGNLNIGRGRLIPSTSWEGLWNGLGEWFGVSSQNVASVLPNLPNFATNVFSATDLFE